MVHPQVAAVRDGVISERINVDWLTLWCPHQGSNLGPADVQVIVLGTP